MKLMIFVEHELQTGFLPRAVSGRLYGVSLQVSTPCRPSLPSAAALPGAWWELADRLQPLKLQLSASLLEAAPPAGEQGRALSTPQLEEEECPLS